jgi:hypothetical protein
LVGGFQEEPEVQAYGCDDVLFNRLIEYFFRGLELPEKTVTYCRRKGNSFDQQYFGKFSKPISEANSVLKPHQSRLQGVIEALHMQRTREVAQRIQNSAVLGRLRPYPAHLR